MDHPSQKTWKAIDLVVLVVLAAVFRVWGLGRLGLYGDEELTALAVRGLLEDGFPHMPSGMPYWRAAPFSFAAAGVAALFGLSEATLRLLPALAGSLTPAALYLLVGRFGAGRQAALAAGAMLALSAWHIDMSREGRMYAVFLAALVANVLLFVDGFVGGRRRAVAGALLLAPVTLLLHELSVTLVLFWAVTLVVGWRQVRFRGGLVVAVGVGALLWAASLKLSKGFVPRVPVDDGAAVSSLADRALDLLYLDFRPRWELLQAGLESGLFPALMALVGLAGFVLVLRAARAADLRPRWIPFAAALGIALGVLELFGLLAALGLLLALVAAGRLTGFVAAYPRFALTWLITVAALGIGWSLYGLAGPAFAGIDGGQRLIATARDLLGYPAPHIRIFFEAFPRMTAVVVAGTAAWILRGGADDRAGLLCRCTFLWLWLPLIGLGFAREWIALRYALPLYPFFLAVWIWAVVGGTRGALELFGSLPRFEALAQRVRWAPFALAMVCLAFPVINEQHGLRPALFWSRLDYGQRTDELIHGFPFHPDHAGAGGHVRERLQPADRVIAMDVQQQQYYVGRVDYRLVRLSERKTFGTYVDGVLRDIYTHAEVLETIPELERVLAAPGGGRVWLITSAEMVGKKARVLPEGAPGWLAAREARRVYTGRDDTTAVYLFE